MAKSGYTKIAAKFLTDKDILKKLTEILTNHELIVKLAMPFQKVGVGAVEIIKDTEYNIYR